MELLTKEQKTRILLAAKTNPALALAQAVTMLAEISSRAIADARAQMSRDLDAAVGKEVDARLRGIPNFSDFNQVFEKIKGKPGEPGKDSDAGAVAKKIMASPFFFRRVRGKDGKTPTRAELASIVRDHMPDAIPGDKGDKGDDADVADIIHALLSDAAFLAKVKGEPGSKPTREELLALLDRYLPGFKDGSAWSGDKIVRRINALEATPKFQIDKRHIKGLDDELAIIRKNLKGERKGGGSGGGGMGNWVHVSVPVNASTTVITLPQKVAADGHAIILRYQGQVLSHGVQYTMTSPRTAQLNFIPYDEIEGFIDATFVRT